MKTVKVTSDLDPRYVDNYAAHHEWTTEQLKSVHRIMRGQPVNDSYVRKIASRIAVAHISLVILAVCIALGVISFQQAMMLTGLVAVVGSVWVCALIRNEAARRREANQLLELVEKQFSGWEQARTTYDQWLYKVVEQNRAWKNRMGAYLRPDGTYDEGHPEVRHCRAMIKGNVESCIALYGNFYGLIFNGEKLPA